MRRSRPPQQLLRHPPANRVAMHLPLMGLPSSPKMLRRENGVLNSSRQSSSTVSPTFALLRSFADIFILRRSKFVTLRSVLRCKAQRPSLRGIAYGFSILFDTLAQQGELSCAACAAAPPTEPLQGPTQGLGVLHCSTLERARVAHCWDFSPSILSA